MWALLIHFGLIVSEKLDGVALLHVTPNLMIDAGSLTPNMIGPLGMKRGRYPSTLRERTRLFSVEYPKSTLYFGTISGIFE